MRTRYEYELEKVIQLRHSNSLNDGIKTPRQLMEMERTKLYQDFLTGRQPEVGCKQVFVFVKSSKW